MKTGKRPPTVFPGDKFGRLTVLREAPKRPNRHDRCYECKCECGSITVVPGYCLRNGNTQSCGCLRIERTVESKTTHGLFVGRANRRLGRGHTYWSWTGMKNRCLDSRDAAYPHYGGRGIRVCGRWLDKQSGYQNFVKDMGERPRGMTLDRIDVNGDYEPSNCRWATSEQQAGNKQAHSHITRLEREVDEQAALIENLRKRLRGYESHT